MTIVNKTVQRFGLVLVVKIFPYFLYQIPKWSSSTSINKYVQYWSLEIQQAVILELGLGLMATTKLLDVDLVDWNIWELSSKTSTLDREWINDWHWNKTSLTVFRILFLSDNFIFILVIGSMAVVGTSSLVFFGKTWARTSLNTTVILELGYYMLKQRLSRWIYILSKDKGSKSTRLMDGHTEWQ